MAKELAMVERNEKGKQARQYFIACEKQLREEPKDQAQPLGAMEDEMRALAFAIGHAGLSPIDRETLLPTTAENLTGIPIPDRPQVERRTYGATEIGERLGISANMVGRLAKLYGLKTDEYGMTVMDKNRYGDKQVGGFRYYGDVLPASEGALRETMI